MAKRAPAPVLSEKPKLVAVRVKGVRSMEALAHFQCGACRKWWAIGDAPPRKQWFCPWCGVENSF